jgi:hypothetical protein
MTVRVHIDAEMSSDNCVISSVSILVCSGIRPMFDPRAHLAK